MTFHQVVNHSTLGVEALNFQRGRPHCTHARARDAVFRKHGVLKADSSRTNLGILVEKPPKLQRGRFPRPASTSVKWEHFCVMSNGHSATCKPEGSTLQRHSRQGKVEARM